MPGREPGAAPRGVPTLRMIVRLGIPRGQDVLVADGRDCFYVYRLRMGDHVQHGIVAGSNVQEYEDDLIKKHEHTRPVKEDDRTRHIDALDANTGPVFLTYKARTEIDELVERLDAGRPDPGHRLHGVGLDDPLPAESEGGDVLFDGHAVELDRPFEARVPSLRHEVGAVYDFDVRRHSLVFDLPPAVHEEAEGRREHRPAVREARRTEKADQSAPGARADQLADLDALVLLHLLDLFDDLLHLVRKQHFRRKAPDLSIDLDTGRSIRRHEQVRTPFLVELAQPAFYRTLHRSASPT